MLSGLTDNKIGLGLGIRASHNGIDGEHCGISCNSNTPVENLLIFDRHFTETVLPRGEIVFNTKSRFQQHRLVASLCMLTKSFPLQ